MTPQENTRIVQDCYAAFGRHDIPALLTHVSDDVDWLGVVGVGPHVPTGGVRKSKAEVARFFQQVGESVDFKTFEPREFLAQGDTVVVLGTYTATIKPTGKSWGSDWVMVFTMRGGKIARFREFTDSYGLSAAYQK